MQPRSKTSDAPSGNYRFHWWIIVEWASNARELGHRLSLFDASSTTFSLNAGLCCLRVVIR